MEYNFVSAGNDSPHDLIIVGAGPAGISAAINAQKSGLNYLLLEKTDHIADTIHCYQKGKFVMAEPLAIPLRGGLWMEPTTRETLLGRWSDAVRSHGVKIEFNAGVKEITRRDGQFHITTGDKQFAARRVVLAMGTQGNPRRLGVPGEDLPHVQTRLADPDAYADQDIVVVGGGDAAIEIALALAAKNRVTMAVRTPEFVRVKDSLERQALDKARKRQLTIHFNSAIEKIEAGSVAIKLSESVISVKARVVIVKIGAIPPRPFLESCGIEFPSKEREAMPVLSKSFETNVPGLFLIGAAGGRELVKHCINQGHEVVEHLCGRSVQPADEALLSEKLNFLAGAVSDRIASIASKVPVLSGASEAQIRELLLSSQFHRMAGGEFVFRQNDFSESFYMILDGQVDVLVKSDDGRERAVAALGPAQFFGEMSLISGRRRSASIRVAKPALLWEASRKAMLKFLHTTPPAKRLVDRGFLVHAFQSYLFPNVEYSSLAKLAGMANVLKFEKGGVIVKEGDPGDAFYFLRMGTVKVSKTSEGREVVLAYLAAGQYFGEMALLSGEPRTATVSAVNKVEVIQVLKGDFLAFLESAPECKEPIRQEINRRQQRNVEVELRPEMAELGRFMIGQEVVVGDNVLLIDQDKCVRCDYCVKACEAVHADGQTRIKRVGIIHANLLVPNSCRHCENPLCMTDCPPGDAIVRDPRGEVYIRDNCIGCGKCAENCPYGNIFMVHPKPIPPSFSLTQWVGRLLGRSEPASAEPTHDNERAFAVKCDLCRGIVGGPSCVRSCPTGAVMRLNPMEYYQRMQTKVLGRQGAESRAE
ncbi:MAG: NAD(P)-binding domain-containing protein [Nitrospirota bacterium]